MRATSAGAGTFNLKRAGRSITKPATAGNSGVVVPKEAPRKHQRHIYGDESMRSVDAIAALH